VDPAAIERLAAEIAEQILAGPVAAPAAPAVAGVKGREGLNDSHEVCPGCVQRCAQMCAKKTKTIVEAGASRVSTSELTTKVDPALASLIDHTILKPEATEAEVRKVCAEARQYGFASVCINPHWVPVVSEELRGTPVKVCTVVGFPLGATSTAAKACEAELAVRAGAHEVDMVMNVGALKSGDVRSVEADIRAVANTCHRGRAILKVIIETALLTDDEKAVACALAKLAGADFVKTSTGFSKHGATAADIALMRKVVGAGMGVKASGGIRTLEDLKAMTGAGASRIGASASVKIVEAASR
jgi:deoxyribose-phosphate aldolase